MPDFYRIDAEQALAELKSSHEGLTEDEVTRRREEYGRNALPTQAGTSLLKVILSQFTNIMVIVLLVAALISLFLGDVKDVIVILVIVVLNAALGTFQEYRAEQSLAALSAMQVPLVRVRRAGEVHQINAEELVPGDVVLLSEGDNAPADGRIINNINMQVEEAALTGESQAVYKDIRPIEDADVALGDRKNMVFMGTAVTYGRGEVVVTNTGLETQLGKIAKMLMGVEEGTTPLQKKLNELSIILVRAAIGIVVVVFIAGLLRGIAVQEMLITSISLAVAAVPEGLPAIVTISLSLGAARMVKRNALIRRLPAVETLGSVTTICSDKTGTLTKNEMTATLLALPGHDDVRVTGIGYEAQGEFQANGDILDPKTDMTVARFLKAMALSTDAYLETNGGQVKVVGDTTEGALLVAAQKVGWDRPSLENDLPRAAELPFSSERKAMTTVHEVKTEENQMLFGDCRFVAITKGAPDQLLGWATREHMPDGMQPLSEERRQRWQEQTDLMAANGLRVLGVAYRPLPELPAEMTPEIERDLVLLGLVGILDPARPEARDAVRVAREAGIRSIMITGDHALTARAIATDLGIITEDAAVMSGNDIEKTSDEELSEIIKTTSVFARVSPEHKLRLVKILQNQQQVVAMTGDGVNDAPALKQADIGVAMGITGTEVSKGAADMVLTDDNFASIVAAVEEGRIIYDNIRKFVMFLLSSNVGEILVMFVGILIGLPIPLLGIQILWVNLVTDGLPAIALGFEPGEPDTMKRKPRPMNESLFAHGVGTRIVWRAALLAALTLIAFYYGHVTHGLQPMSPTLGIEALPREELVSFLGEDVIPADWDELSTEERLAHVDRNIESDEGESEIYHRAERIPRTIAFTVLALGQIFHVSAIHAGDRLSFFRTWFSKNKFMLWAVISTFVLQFLVIYVPFLQATFETYPIRLPELLACIGIAALMLVVVEIEKLVLNWRRPLPQDAAA